MDREWSGAKAFLGQRGEGTFRIADFSIMFGVTFGIIDPHELIQRLSGNIHRIRDEPVYLRPEKESSLISIPP
jgi:hypothetical protein